jgi:hypothetical protein
MHKDRLSLEFFKPRLLRSFLLTTLMILVVVLLIMSSSESHLVKAQFPTVDIPTVTSSPRGPYVVVDGSMSANEPINVRAGPSGLTEKIGILLVGQEANAIGKYGEYIQIEYPGVAGGKGWVFATYVKLIGGDVPLVEPPPTSTPQTTKTIDPTLAAQFIITAQPSRLPTFTEPPPLAIPTFEIQTGGTATGGIPMGFVIIGLALLGIFLGLISIMRRG